MKIDSSCAGLHHYVALKTSGKYRKAVRMALLYGASFRLLGKKYPLRLIKTEYKRVTKGYTKPEQVMCKGQRLAQKSGKQLESEKKSLVVTFGFA